MLPERERSHVTPTPLSSAAHAYPRDVHAPLVASPSSPSPDSVPITPRPLLPSGPVAPPPTLCLLPVWEGEMHTGSLRGGPQPRKRPLQVRPLQARLGSTVPACGTGAHSGLCCQQRQSLVGNPHKGSRPEPNGWTSPPTPRREYLEAAVRGDAGLSWHQERW